MTSELLTENINYSDGFHCHISSAERIVGTSSNFSVTCSIPKMRPDKQFNRVCVVETAIPKSWWLVVAPYNTFYIYELGIKYLVTVPPGNYNINQWVTQIPPLMTAASRNGWTYTAARQQSPETGFITYSVTGNGINQPGIINSDGGLTNQLGFPQSVNPYMFVGNSITGSIVYDSQGTYAVHIISDVAQDDGGPPIICDIFGAGLTPFLGIMQYQAQDHVLYSKRFIQGTSNVFQFQICSATTGRYLDLNGLDIEIHLKFFRVEDQMIDVTRKILETQQALLKKFDELKSASPSQAPQVVPQSSDTTQNTVETTTDEPVMVEEDIPTDGNPRAGEVQA